MEKPDIFHSVVRRVRRFLRGIEVPLLYGYYYQNLPTQRTFFGTRSIYFTIARWGNVLWIILAGAAGVFFLIAGYQYLFAQGKPDKVQEAHRMILYGLLAVAVGLVSFGLVFLADELISSTP